MASEKKINTRLQLKIDTTTNWNTASSNGFIPKKGEPIIYLDSNTSVPKIKFGNGLSLLGSLPFFGSDATQTSGGIAATDVSSGNIVISNLNPVALAEDTGF